MQTPEPVSLGGLAPEQRPAYSRALLMPGPLPPLSHLGVTLLRHSVETGLRYALYHLGLPVPEASQAKVVRLRLYLDARELRESLVHAPGGADVVAALLEPGGTGALPAASRPLAAALAFHRLRLVRLRLPAGRPPELRRDEAPEAVWRRMRAELSRLLHRTNDALLADLIAAIDRRNLRARGEEVPPALSRAAWRLRTGGRADLRSFGVPDLLAPSWAAAPERAAAARRALEPYPMPGYDRYRGRFREAYRAALDRLAPLYRTLARQAAERGFVGAPEDAYFLPLDLAGDLAASRKPGWLEAAVRGNRLEYDSLRRAAEPLDVMTAAQEMGSPGGERPEWEWAPLLPLP